ncbi:ThrRS/AlaRS common domain-containing protein, partial [Ramicandelaber brevisporus]
VGRLACQRDSYQRTLDAIVVECKPSATQPGHFEVTLDDTVLFPEGGGQPADHGTIDGTPVVTVQRRGLSAVHVVPKQLAEGTSVKLEVDYTRRFDVMQQHTGQHLITAVIEKELGLRTVSWSLGSEISYIELDSGAKGKQAPTIDQIATAEAHIDEYIRASLPISVATITKSDISSSTGVSLDKLPDDLAGSGDLAVRVVSIGDMDRNPCCGTHMQNSAHLQSIKLLHMERVSGGNVKLHFVAGGRVLQLLGKLHDHSRTLTGLLSGGVDMQVDAVKRLQDSARAATKSTTRLSRELA